MQELSIVQFNAPIRYDLLRFLALPTQIVSRSTHPKLLFRWFQWNPKEYQTTDECLNLSYPSTIDVLLGVSTTCSMRIHRRSHVVVQNSLHRFKSTSTNPKPKYNTHSTSSSQHSRTRNRNKTHTETGLKTQICRYLVLVQVTMSLVLPRRR